MMSDLLLITAASFVASLLSFYSGFGLGTVLMPVFAVIFSVDMAVAMTAIIHLTTNLFKLVLVGRYMSKKVVIRFGLPALVAAFFGAQVLVRVSNLPPVATYRIWGDERHILPVKLVIASLMVFFALMEIVPCLKRMSFASRHLSLGGMLSGFFGGLSGHQGALRSAFLIRANLSKEEFIATGVVIACLVDVARLGIYSAHFSTSGIEENTSAILLPMLSAFIGTYLGKKYLTQMTLAAIQYLVSTALFFLALALGAGFI